MSRQSLEQITALLTPVVVAAGADVEHIGIRRAGKRSVLTVLVDQDGGIDLDDIARISREISKALDVTEILAGQPYVLEVSSPGVDRPLTMPRHWRRNEGRLVEVVTVGGATLTGRVVGSDDRQVELLVGEDSRVVPYADIVRARVQVEFGKHGTTAEEA
ncbi:MAG: ribosome maturation factor RimP [Actinomycetes bacterium]